MPVKKMKSSKVDNDTKKSSRSVKSAASDESPPKSRSRTSPSRSPARGRKLSPGPRASRRSPARKSPARKSPARKSPSRKSPARKSPSRNAVKEEEPSKSPSRRPPIKSESKSVPKILSNVKVEIPRLVRPSRQTIAEYSIKDIKSVDVVNGKDLTRDGLRERKPIKLPEDTSSKIASRRSIRLKESTEYEKLLSLAQSTKLPKSDYSFENFSDSENVSDDDSALNKRTSATRTLVTPLFKMDEPEFGGPISVVSRLLLAPLVIVGINIACSHSRCSFSALPNLKPYTKLENWINLKSMSLYLSFILLQVLLALVPYFGRRVHVPWGRHSFVANGIFSFISTVVLIFSLEYLDIPVVSTVYSQYFQLLITSIVYSTLAAIALFILSKNVPEDDLNPFANTDSALHDFWAGREINPYIGKLHVKMVLLRTAHIAAALINIVTLYQGVNVKNFPILSTVTLQEIETYQQIYQSISISPTLVVFASIQIIYFLNAISKESSFFSTFEHQYEGTGLMITLGYAIYPFTTMSITRYVLDYNVVLPYYILAVVLVSYITGLYIYNASNAQKSCFRENPHNPKVAHLDSLPTFQGKRLLISGWWGFVRHPNYLGDILVHLSWAVGALRAPPVLFILATVLFLAHRAARDGRRCRQRYGTAWDRYCTRVPYNILPRVY